MSIPTPTLMCGGSSNPEEPRVNGILQPQSDMPISRLRYLYGPGGTSTDQISASSFPADQMRQDYHSGGRGGVRFSRDELLEVRRRVLQTTGRERTLAEPETPTSIRILRHGEAQSRFESASSSETPDGQQEDEYMTAVMDLACDAEIPAASPSSTDDDLPTSSTGHPSSRLLRIARPDALVVTYRYCGDDKIIFDWTDAPRHEDVFVGDYGSRLEDVIRVPDSGRLKIETEYYLVTFEIAVARHAGILSDTAAGILWNEYVEWYHEELQMEL
ncbi:uncharacterized protein RCC_08462 [Ramularia collo-cygni]|uniref:Uncharacterized protein n=1 Tax=Ramularia collo-cygni TaxID=112498 RepID=A0A2D3UXK3_9PEZI|nr:uncharacterized protein RCC_08462 [Ramularia collo-cygni]CZT22757.1 uncharacterized protein RCC_08462 [Ramularia collo-cygni]